MNLIKSPIVMLAISIVLGVCGQFLFKHGLNKLTGSADFLVSHLKNPASLAMKLKDAKDPVSLYLKNCMSSEAQQKLANYDGSNPPPIELQQTLVDELNKLIKGPNLYDRERFKNVALTDKTLKLSSKNPKGKDLIYLNRSLLMEAYPDELLPAGIDLTPRIVFIFFTPYIFCGLTLYVLSTFTWLSGLSKVPLSFAYPLLSTGYLLIFLISVLFLGEKYTHTKLLANLLIIAGISLLFYGKN